MSILLGMQRRALILSLLLRAAACAAELYVCPMHPDVTSKIPGKCPKCGMALRVGLPPATPLDDSPIRIPDVMVLDQNGREIPFYSGLVKGKTVAIDFIFTTCTTTCPLLTANFRRVQQTLTADGIGEFQLISISVDPLTDVPPRLQSFAAQFHAGPGWTFVTGAKPEMDRLLRALGASVADKNDHTPMILVGNDSSQHWRRVSGLTSPAVIVRAIKEAAQSAR